MNKLDGLDVLVNLMGAPIADRPWTRARRQVLYDSRVKAMQSIADSLGKLPGGPEHLIGVSGLGRFGPERGEEILDDDAPPGGGFLAELSCAWEESQIEAGADLGCRTAVLRMSICLSPTGGVFPLMVKPFRVGFGGWLGNGKQFTSWIGIRDTVGCLMHLMDHPLCEGGFNGTVPEPTRNKEWCRALGRALHRPVMTHAPQWALRGALGELANDLFLSSLRCVPRKLHASGYRFQDVEPEDTFSWLLEQLADEQSDIMENRIPRRRIKRRDRRRG